MKEVEAFGMHRANESVSSHSSHPKGQWGGSWLGSSPTGGMQWLALKCCCEVLAGEGREWEGAF